MGVKVAIPVGVSVAVEVRVALGEGVSEGSTIRVGSAEVERPTGLKNKYSAMPHITRHNAAMTNKNRRIHHLRSLVAET